MIITLKNNFHNTEVRVNVPNDGELSIGQAKRVRKMLCGSDSCTCGVVRGPQDFPVDWVEINSCWEGSRRYDIFTVVFKED